MGAGRGNISDASATINTIIRDVQQAGNAAVLSIQSIQGMKAVLQPNEIENFIQHNPTINFDRTGDGHTGLAMARALNAP